MLKNIIKIALLLSIVTGCSNTSFIPKKKTYLKRDNKIHLVKKKYERGFKGTLRRGKTNIEILKVKKKYVLQTSIFQLDQMSDKKESKLKKKLFLMYDKEYKIVFGLKFKFTF